MVHLYRFDLSGHISWSKGDKHAWFDDTSFNSANWHCSNTTNFVNILKWETESLVCWAFRGRMASRALIRVLPEALPSFLSIAHPLYQLMFEDSSSMLSPFHPEIGTKATHLGLKPIFLM